MVGNIFEIKRFAVHDGDGVRTTVFFKGCPLKCVWCHNPESLSFDNQLAYYKDKCVNCANCVEVCPEGAHYMKNGVHFFDRNTCVSCGKCTKMCFGNALNLYGKKYTVEELLSILLEDKEFYDESNGGVTLSGGECLMQADFCSELLKSLKENGVHTAIDTCGFVSKQALDKVLDYTDIFLYDLKAVDDDSHIKCTGVSNEKILENLMYLDECNKAIEVRIPFVPGYNNDQIEKMIEVLKKLKNLKNVRVLPYHNYAGSKYESLEMENTLPSVLPTKEDIKNIVDTFCASGIKAI